MLRRPVKGNGIPAIINAAESHMGDAMPRKPNAAKSVADADVRVVEHFLDARAVGNIEACVSVVAESAMWHGPVDDPRRGRAGFRRALAGAFENSKWFETETLGIRARGDVVVAKIRNRGERDGELLDAIQMLIFTVRAGAIADVKIRVDDPAAVAEFWTD